MDKSAPQTVALGTFVTSAASAFVTGLYGILTGKGQYTTVLAGASALNTGITAVTFFSIREYVVSPILVTTAPTAQYVHRKQRLEAAQRKDPSAESASMESEISAEPSWAEMRAFKMFDTGISGAATGGVLRGWRGGRPAVIPGAITFGALCMLCQLAFNELSVARVKYVSRALRDVPIPSPGPQSRTPREAPVLPLDRPKSISERIFTTLGFKKVSDEEYLKKLKATRDAHLKEIARLEAQIEAEKNQK